MLAIISIVTMYREGSLLTPILKSIADKISSDDENKPLSRLKLLTSLFNVAFDQQSKYYILTSKTTRLNNDVLVTNIRHFVVTMKYSISTKLSQHLFHVHDTIDSWISLWSLSSLENRSLYNLMSQILFLNNKQSLAVDFASKSLKALKNEPIPSDMEEFISVVLLNAIKLPISCFSERSNLLEVLISNR